MKKVNLELLGYALESLKNGISVIPVAKDKKPLIAWREFQTRYATEEEVRDWFYRFDEPQLGFVTGKISNLTVVDIEKGGDPSFLPQETMIVSTGGGGYHYYFNFEEGINNKARIKELVDIRGEGGYVVAPNSTSEKGPYAVLQTAPLLRFPKELFPPKVDIFQSASSNSSTFQKKDIQEFPGYGKGQRNDETARYIGYILTQIHPSEWSTTAWSLIVAANNRNTPPLSSNELVLTFESIKRVEVRNNPLGRSTGQNPGTNLYPSREKEEPIIFDDDEVMHIADVADRQKINSSESFPLQMPCFDEILEGGVNLGDVVVIAGQTGHGKTTLAQDWTMSLVRQGIKSLWFSYEVLPLHLWKKFQSMGMNREDCAFIPAKHSTGNVAWVEQKIKEGKEKFGIRAVFIDHLGFLLPKTNGVLGKAMSSNYAAFLTQVMRDLKTIALQEEVIIFLPVHMKKVDSRNRLSDSDDIKDSSGIGQESDLVFLIEREKNKEKDAKTYFTDITKITLAKNRKTGQTLIANFSMLQGRFAYDVSNDEAKKNISDYEKLTTPYNNDDDDDDYEKESTQQVLIEN